MGKSCGLGASFGTPAGVSPYERSAISSLPCRTVERNGFVRRRPFKAAGLSSSPLLDAYQPLGDLQTCRAAALNEKAITACAASSRCSGGMACTRDATAARVCSGIISGPPPCARTRRVPGAHPRERHVSSGGSKQEPPQYGVATPTSLATARMLVSSAHRGTTFRSVATETNISPGAASPPRRRLISPSGVSVRGFRMQHVHETL